MIAGAEVVIYSVPENIFGSPVRCFLYFLFVGKKVIRPNAKAASFLQFTNGCYWNSTQICRSTQSAIELILFDPAARAKAT